MGNLTKWTLLSAFAVIFILLGTSCQDASTVGANTFDGEVIEISGSETFDITGKTFKMTQPISYLSTTLRNTFMVGQIDDRKLGTIDAQVFSQVVRNPLTTAPVLDDVEIDSVILILRYDTLGFYGNLANEHELSIYEIDDDYIDEDSIRTDRSLMTLPTVIGSKNIIAAPNDSVTITNHRTGEENTLTPQIRIELDKDWASTWIQDSATVSSDISLYSAMKGINIRSNSDNSLLGLSLGDAGLVNTITVYYTRDTVKATYDFRLSRRKFANIVIDHNVGEVSNFIDNPAMGDSLLFVQGIDGLAAELNFNDLSFLEGKRINHAELVFTVADLIEDELNLYPALNQLFASTYREDDMQELSIISDISNLGISGVNVTLNDGFGGNIETDATTGKMVYKCNITNRLKEIQESEGEDTEIVISSSNRVENPRRTILYGVNHSEYPVKLRVVYTTP